MTRSRLNDIPLHYRDAGDPDGAPVVFAHALGTDLHLWDALIPYLPAGLRLIRYDIRGHGQSAVPPPPYAMGALVRDAEALLDHLGVRDCVVVGLSLGGMIAQGLAVKRLDQVRALVLANTAAKIGQPQMWQARAEAVRTGGMAAVADQVLARWFSRDPGTAGRRERWRAQVLAQDPLGYAGCCAAIARPTAASRSASGGASVLPAYG